MSTASNNCFVGWAAFSPECTFTVNKVNNVNNVINDKGDLMKIKNSCRALSFTLIELLVVIAIISILMTMLLPALKMVMREGRLTSCMNNQRQLGIATHLYLNDYDEYMPRPWPGVGGMYDGGYTWINTVTQTTPPFQAMGLAVFYKLHYMRDSGSAYCPGSRGTTLDLRVNPIPYLVKNGCFESNTNKPGGVSTTYYMNTVEPWTITPANQWIAINVWRNMVNYIGPRLRDNLPGGNWVKNNGVVLGRNTTPRVILMCTVKNHPATDRWPSHDGFATNVLFADGVCQRNRIVSDVFAVMREQSMLKRTGGDGPLYH